MKIRFYLCPKKVTYINVGQCPPSNNLAMKTTYVFFPIAFVVCCLFMSTSGCMTAQKSPSVGEYHKGFLDWPSVVEELKDTGEGALGYAYSQLIFSTASVGQKDWFAIFKDPRISMHLKHDLLWDIHEMAIKDMYSCEKTSCRVCGQVHGFTNNVTSTQLESSDARKDETQEDRSLHDKVLAYVEKVRSVGDEPRLMGDLYVLLWEACTSKGESELPCVFMEAHIPVSIKAHFIWVLSGSYQDK